ncbi:hypothetical protein COCVIDRAFT_96443, partial [Bipolaris victoriae FI3]
PNLVFVRAPYGDRLASAAWRRPKYCDRVAGGIYEPVLRTRCAKVASARGPRPPCCPFPPGGPCSLALPCTWARDHCRFATGCGPSWSSAGLGASISCVMRLLCSKLMVAWVLCKDMSLCSWTCSHSMCGSWLCPPRRPAASSLQCVSMTGKPCRHPLLTPPFESTRQARSGARNFR